MSALHPDTVKLIYEGIASLVVALITAWVLFNVFFDDWRDYFACCGRWSGDASDRARGFVYNGLWGGAGVVAFYFIHKLLR